MIIIGGVNYILDQSFRAYSKQFVDDYMNNYMSDNEALLKELASLNDSARISYSISRNDSIHSMVYGYSLAAMLYGDDMVGNLMPHISKGRVARQSNISGLDWEQLYYTGLDWASLYTEETNKIYEAQNIFDEVIKHESNVIRPIEQMYRRDNSKDRYFKPVGKDYVLSDNTKSFLANSIRIYGKQEKSSYNKNGRKAKHLLETR